MHVRAHVDMVFKNLLCLFCSYLDQRDGLHACIKISLLNYSEIVIEKDAMTLTISPIER